MVVRFSPLLYLSASRDTTGVRATRTNEKKKRERIEAREDSRGGRGGDSGHTGSGHGRSREKRNTTDRNVGRETDRMDETKVAMAKSFELRLQSGRRTWKPAAYRHFTEKNYIF